MAKQKTVKLQKRFQWKKVVCPVILLVVIIIILEAVTQAGLVADYILPPPSSVWTKTIGSFSEILPQLLFTLKIIFIGFGVSVALGMALAALFSQFNILVKAFTPLILFLVITPMITVIPLLNLWLGIEPNLRVVAVIIQATPIITLNTLTGFTTVEMSKRELARSVGATKMQAFSKIAFMNAMPQVFTGIKLGGIFAVIGAISADTVAGMTGLGFYIQVYMKYSMMAQCFGVIILIAIIGIALYTIIEVIEHKVVVWKN